MQLCCIFNHLILFLHRKYSPNDAGKVEKLAAHIGQIGDAKTNHGLHHPNMTSEAGDQGWKDPEKAAD